MKKKTEIRQTYLQQRKKKMLSDVVFFMILGSILSSLLFLPSILLGLLGIPKGEEGQIAAIYLGLVIIWFFFGSFIFLSYLGYVEALKGVYYDGKYLRLFSDKAFGDSKEIKMTMRFYVKPNFIEHVKWVDEEVIFYLNEEYPEYDKISYLSVSKKFVDDEDRFRKELNMLGINIE